MQCKQDQLSLDSLIYHNLVISIRLLSASCLLSFRRLNQYLNLICQYHKVREDHHRNLDCMNLYVVFSTRNISSSSLIILNFIRCLCFQPCANLSFIRHSFIILIQLLYHYYSIRLKYKIISFMNFISLRITSFLLFVNVLYHMEQMAYLQYFLLYVVKFSQSTFISITNRFSIKVKMGFLFSIGLYLHYKLFTF